MAHVLSQGSKFIRRRSWTFDVLDRPVDLTKVEASWYS